MPLNLPLSISEILKFRCNAGVFIAYIRKIEKPGFIGVGPETARFPWRPPFSLTPPHFALTICGLTSPIYDDDMTVVRVAQPGQHVAPVAPRSDAKRKSSRPDRSLFLFVACGACGSRVRPGLMKAAQYCMYLTISDTCNILSQRSLLTASIQNFRELRILTKG